MKTTNDPKTAQALISKFGEACKNHRQRTQDQIIEHINQADRDPYEVFILTLNLHRIMNWKDIVVSKFTKALELKMKANWPAQTKQLKYRQKFRHIAAQILESEPEIAELGLDDIFNQTYLWFKS